MPVLAKQVATLDQLSGGRVILGVGTGAYREEYEALFPDARDVRRGTIVDEGMQALRLLFTERRATFRGQTVRFEEVECFPKPVQDPMPIYAGGNHPEVRRRAGQYAQGWMPAVLSPEEIERGVAEIHRAAAAVGRDGSQVDIAPQFAVSIGRTHEEAVRRFRASQLFKHLESLKRSTLREQTGGLDQRNLIAATRSAGGSGCTSRRGDHIRHVFVAARPDGRPSTVRPDPSVSASRFSVAGHAQAVPHR
jgi:alkanesulfonate monooxygenase SsuD/methylene tetrahydromethanopterin reductase-like flavin-dependent oxidoreductase (luciferase family)